MHCWYSKSNRTKAYMILELNPWRSHIRFMYLHSNIYFVGDYSRGPCNSRSQIHTSCMHRTHSSPSEPSPLLKQNICGQHCKSYEIIYLKVSNSVWLTELSIRNNCGPSVHEEEVNWKIKTLWLEIVLRLRCLPLDVANPSSSPGITYVSNLS